MKKLKGNLYREGETATNFIDVYEEPPVGAYVCRIEEVEDHPEWEALVVQLDISEGSFEGYYKRLFDRAGFWGNRIFCKYTENASGLFKKFCHSINASNEGFLFNPFDDGNNADEQTLKGKTVGMVLHIEEYVKGDGSLGVKLTGQYPGFISVEAAKAGKFSKRLLEKGEARNKANSPASENFMQVNDDTEGIPFN